MKGWYADPETAIFGKEYWIYPTYSAPYEEQVHFDAFSSKDLVHWTVHPRILDTQSVSWAHKAMWAPAIVHKDKKYYFFFSANDIHHPGQEDGGIGVAVSDHPGGQFKRIGKILQQDTAIATGAGHHSVIHMPGKDQWYIVYHRRPPGETDPNHRVVCIDEMHFSEDGKILPVKITKEGVRSAPLFLNK